MTLEHPEAEEIRLEDVLHALSDPQRLRIVRALGDSEDPMPCMAMKLGVTKSTASHHFRILREAGVIRQEKCGTSKMTTLRRDDLDDRFPGLLGAVLTADSLAAA
ncbi:helix-turn-helix transcriptional regulator [soil metagenome]